MKAAQKRAQRAVSRIAPGRRLDARIDPVPIKPVLVHRQRGQLGRRAGKSVVVVADVVQKREADLLQIVDADDVLALGLGFGQRGQEHRRQNGDDRDHHQQFDERKCDLPVLDWLPEAFGTRTHRFPGFAAINTFQW